MTSQKSSVKIFYDTHVDSCVYAGSQLEKSEQLYAFNCYLQRPSELYAQNVYTVYSVHQCYFFSNIPQF